MFHQYHAAKGIMFVPPIQFGSRTSYNTRTQPYFANSNRIRLSQTGKYARHQGIIVWNNLPSRLKELMPYTNFYDATKTFFVC